MSIFENNKNSIKPIKIFLKSSNTTNNLDNPEEKNSIKENSPQIPEQNINQILHETKLRKIIKIYLLRKIVLLDIIIFILIKKIKMEV